MWAHSRKREVPPPKAPGISRAADCGGFRICPSGYGVGESCADHARNVLAFFGADLRQSGRTRTPKGWYYTEVEARD